MIKIVITFFLYCRWKTRFQINQKTWSRLFCTYWYRNQD